MISLCKTFHDLVGYPDPDERCRSVPRRRRGVPPSDATGLRCFAGELPTPPPHVVECATVGLRPPVVLLASPSSPSPLPTQEQHHQQPVERIDEGTRGLSYLYGGGGLELWTESLGFESCCDGKMGAEEAKAEGEIQRRIEEDKRRSPGRREARLTARRRSEVREFPPPLPWLGAGGPSGGRCCTFLKGVRKDGRFLLTQVRIERPEVLRASRRDGRLRLELVEPGARAVGEEENVSEAAAEKVEQVVVRGGIAPEEEAEEEGDEEAAGSEEERPQWRLPSALERREGGGGGFRSGRCQEAVREGLPSSSPFWSTQFATTA